MERDEIYCFECDDYMKYQVKVESNEYQVLEEENIPVNEKVAICEGCGGRLDQRGLQMDNLKRLYKRYKNITDRDINWEGRIRHKIFQKECLFQHSDCINTYYCRRCEKFEEENLIDYLRKKAIKNEML